MTDIPKRTGAKGVTYQVRYATRTSKTGYAYKTFATLKEARHYVESGLSRHRHSRHRQIRFDDQAVDKWLDVVSIRAVKARTLSRNQRSRATRHAPL